MKAVTASSDVPFAQEQLCTSGLEELMEELTEEPRVGSVGQQKENIVDLSSVIITTTTSEELREIKIAVPPPGLGTEWAGIRAP